MIDLKRLSNELKIKYNDCEYYLFWDIINMIDNNIIKSLDDINDLYNDYLKNINSLGPINQEYIYEMIDFCRYIIDYKLNEKEIDNAYVLDEKDLIKEELVEIPF